MSRSDSTDCSPKKRGCRPWKVLCVSSSVMTGERQAVCDERPRYRKPKELSRSEQSLPVYRAVISSRDAYLLQFASSQWKDQGRPPYYTRGGQRNTQTIHRFPTQNPAQCAPVNGS